MDNLNLEEMLKERINQECGILVFGKKPQGEMDFHTIFQRKLTSEARRDSRSPIPSIVFNPYMDQSLYLGMLKRGAELLRYISANMLARSGDSWMLKQNMLL